MSTPLNGKSAIVTGAARGIGAAYAGHLARLGAEVLVADIDEGGAERTAKELCSEGLAAWSRSLDIAQPAQAQGAVSEVVDRTGSLDILVNNAAIYNGIQMELAEDIDIDYWKRMVDVNLSGTYYMCRAAIPRMRSQGSGKIVNQASIAAFLAAPMALHYCTTKAAVVTMTQCLASEVGEDGIQVNAIAPGVINTDATMATPAPVREMAVMQSSLKRIGTPEDLLGALEFLCSSASDFMTGQTLVVDGGLYKLG